MKSWSGKRHHTWAHTWFEQRASSWLTDLKYKSLDLKSIRCAFLVAESTCPNWCIGSESGYLVIILWSFFSNLAWLRVRESLQTQCRQSRWRRSLSLPVARKLDRDTQQRKASVKPMTVVVNPFVRNFDTIQGPWMHSQSPSEAGMLPTTRCGRVFFLCFFGFSNELNFPPLFSEVKAAYGQRRIGKGNEACFNSATG